MVMKGFVSPETTGSIRTTGHQYITYGEAVAAAKTSFRNGDYGLAQSAYQRAIELNANSAEGWLGLAASYDRLRRFDMADRAYSQLHVLMPGSAIYFNNVGYSYMLRGDLMKARENFTRASEIDPGNPVVEHNIAMLRASIGYTAR
jgi:Flp pilus assembly protein TadD